MQQYSFAIITNAPMNTEIISKVLPILDYFGVGVQAVFTDTCTGTFQLEVSNDGVNWITVTDSIYTVTAGGNYAWNFWQNYFRYLRLHYLDTGGGTATGILNVLANAKGN